MLSRLRIARAPVYALLGLFVWAGTLTHKANADIIPTQALIQQSQSDALRERLSSALEREDVLQQLQAHGVNPEDAAKRVAALTDQEAQLLAAQIDELPAGGNVVLLLVVIILVMLLR